MKKLLFLLSFTLCFVTTHAFAEMLMVPTDEDVDPLGFEFDVQGTYIGEADVARGSFQINNFDEWNFAGRLLVLPRTKIGILRLGAEYEIFDFGIPQGTQLPNRLQSAALVLGLDTKFSDSLLVRVEARPGYYYANDLEGQDFNVPFLIGGTYLYSSTVQFVFGIGVDLDGEYPVLPGGGVRWKFHPQWVLNAALPTPRLEYAMSRNLMFYAGIDLRSKNFRVDNNVVGDPGDPGDLNNAILNYTEVRAGGGLTWNIGESCKLTFDGGYLPWRQFNYHRTEVRYHYDGGAPYAAISFHGSF